VAIHGNTYYEVAGLEHVLLFNILGIMIPTDFHTFQRGRYTTNQMRLDQDLYILDTRDEPLKIAPIFYRGHQSMSPDLDSHSRMYIIIVGLYKCIHNYIELYRYRYCLSYIYIGISWYIMGYQWEFQDPKMEVLYHIVGHILWGHSLT
jgi:hypothetical protein